MLDYIYHAVPGKLLTPGEIKALERDEQRTKKSNEHKAKLAKLEAKISSLDDKLGDIQHLAYSKLDRSEQVMCLERNIDPYDLLACVNTSEAKNVFRAWSKQLSETKRGPLVRGTIMPLSIIK
jgi:predicted RNase H-like nuclease (RuvC/YqgF family)